MKDSASATERVGRYQILDTIGSGPNGTVSRAKVFGVAGFERQFAVKRFSPELTVQTQHAQALSAAARAYGGLEHPRIARMSEYGVAAGVTFTAVEHVAGLDAMRLLTETKLAGVALAIGGALALVSQAARAVGYAHGRGLSHLGLSPTNVIVTIDGDVKVTDFGILAATMAPRPVDEGRLAQRIAYLAPEQLVGESTSAATDVFVLGVIACELVTGHRTFRGDTPKQIADAILAGPPPEPPLPRPIVRVLQRCLARSPFERFPDARALADALDAALRVAPVPGTRKDIGAQIKAIVDRLGELNEGNLSGMLSVNVPAQRRELDTVPSGEPIVRGKLDTEPSPILGPAALAAAGSTIPEMPKAMTTVPGLAPPPIPVPPGVMTGGSPPPSPTGAPTMMGVPAVKRGIPGVPPQIPSIVKPAGKGAVDKAVDAIKLPSTDGDLGAPRTSAPALAPPPDRPRSPTPGQNFESRTGEMSQKQLQELNRRAIAPSGEHKPLVLPEPEAPGARAVTSSTTTPAAPAYPSSTPTTPAAPAYANSAVTSPASPAYPGAPESKSPASTSPAAPAYAGLAKTPSASGQAIAKTLMMSPTPVAPTPAPPPAEASPPAATPQAATMLLDPSPAAPPSEAEPRPRLQMDDIFTPPPGPPPKRAETGASPVDFFTPIAHDAPESASRPMFPSVPPPIAQPAETGPFPPNPPPSDFAPPPAYTPPQDYAPPPAYAPPEPNPASTWPGPAPQPPKPYATVSRASTAHVRKSRWPWLLFTLLLLGGLGAGGYFVYLQYFAEKPAATKIVMASGSGSAAVATGSGSAAVETGSAAVATGSGNASGSASVAVATGSGSAAAGSGSAVVVHTPPDAAVVATAPVDAPAAAPVDAGKAVAAATGTSDALEITSTPPGAHVYLDGADQGKTPVKLPGTADRHNVALLLAGHDLYVGEVDGHGKFNLELKALTPHGGPAGIKVIKCKVKDRYYVFVDGKPTGMMCPTERINTTIGAHTVEVYDAVSESRQKWDINIKDDRLSFRVRIDEH